MSEWVSEGEREGGREGGTCTSREGGITYSPPVVPPILAVDCTVVIQGANTSTTPLQQSLRAEMIIHQKSMHMYNTHETKATLGWFLSLYLVHVCCCPYPRYWWILPLMQDRAFSTADQSAWCSHVTEDRTSTLVQTVSSPCSGEWDTRVCPESAVDRGNSYQMMNCL